MSSTPGHRFRYHVAGILALTGYCLAVPGQADAMMTGTNSTSPSPAGSNLYHTLQLDFRNNELWGQLRQGFALSHETHNPRVQHWLQWYQSHPDFLTQANTNARRWIRWVTHRVEARNLPAELALLPFVESAYDPRARNPAGSAGMWQFMPMTGDEMGLARNSWYDGRMDVIAATDAALSYLTQQTERWYNGDWKLALAAYNAGPGTVNRAIARAERQGQPTDYWHLELPEETMDYVPKLLALSTIVAHPERYGITLPAISDQPVFAQVDTNGQLNLATAARLSGVGEQRLRALNPAYTRTLTRPHDNPPLLVPIDHADRFRRSLAQLTPEQRQGWQTYVVSRGDTLSGLAAQYSVSMSELKRHNQLSGSHLRIGQTLMVPGTSGKQVATAAKQTIRVRHGDSLWAIAKRHDVGLDKLAQWNGISSDAPLQPGQQLTLY